MLVGLLGLGAATILFSVSASFTQLMLARIFQGLSGAATWSVGLSMIADIYSNEELGLVMGIVLSGNTIGMVCGPVVGGVFHDYAGPLFWWLYDILGEKSPFYVCAALAFLDFLMRLMIGNTVESGSAILKLIENQEIAANDADVGDLESQRLIPPKATRLLGFEEQKQFLSSSSDKTSPPSIAITNDHGAQKCSLADQASIESHDETTHLKLHPTTSGFTSFSKLFFAPSVLVTTVATIICSSLFSGTHLLLFWTYSLFDYFIFFLMKIKGMESALPFRLSGHFHQSPSNIGLLFTLIIIPNIFISIFIGKVSNYFGRKRTSGVGMLLIGIASPFLGIPEMLYLEGISMVA